MKHQLVYQEGFPFGFNPAACNTCNSRCCRGRSGNIWVTSREMAAICHFSGANIIDGLGEYFIKRQNRFSIREKNLAGEWHCIFLESGIKCGIYPVRPLQCRQFPFWPHFKQNVVHPEKECPGIVVIEPALVQGTSP
ncbi:YkgJ family cysteine cluster protein [Desulfocicer niacini]